MFKWFKDKFNKDKDTNEDNLVKQLEEKDSVDINIEEVSNEITNAENLEDVTIANDESPIEEDKKEVRDSAFTGEVFEENIEVEEKIKEDTEIKKESHEKEMISNIDEVLEKDDKEELIDNKEENVDNKEKKVSVFQRLKEGLTKTRHEMGVKINTLLGQYVKIDDEMMEDLEDILISADIGMETTMTLIDNLKETIINNKINDPSLVKDLLKEEVKKLMNPDLDNKIITKSPTIILVIGVNGVGKTTTIGKLSSRLRNEGNKVLIAAADTFRAAAIEQLKTWGDRSNVDVISHTEGADPAAVIFDAISAAKSRNTDILICDTAGRLHNKANLMKELEKINKVIEREYPNCNRETLLVLDATTGQNAMNQAKTFNESSEITGIVLTKLDGTAKGGVVIALQSELQVPIKLIGVGEKIEDLQNFDMNSFIDAIFD